MRLTLKQKREFVERFKNGDSCGSIGIYGRDKFGNPTGARERRNQTGELEVQAIIRDFINGKFTLTTKRAKRGE